MRLGDHLHDSGEEGVDVWAAAYVDQAVPRIHAWANEALCHVAQGDELRTMLLGARKLLKYQPINAIALRRDIAKAVSEKEGYPLD